MKRPVGSRQEYFHDVSRRGARSLQKNTKQRNRAAREETRSWRISCRQAQQLTKPRRRASSRNGRALPMHFASSIVGNDERRVSELTNGNKTDEILPSMRMHFGNRARGYDRKRS